jgi:hypothetical protein
MPDILKRHLLLVSTRISTVKLEGADSGFGGLEDACWPLVPKFAGSNPAEAVVIFRAKKSPARLPSEGKYSRRSYVVDLRHVKDP